MTGCPSVCLHASVLSTGEVAAGLANAGDEIEISILHRGSVPRRIKVRVTTHAFMDGTFRLSLRQVYENGRTRLIERIEIGSEIDDTPSGTIDLTGLAPPPMNARRAKLSC